MIASLQLQLAKTHSCMYHSGIRSNRLVSRLGGKGFFTLSVVFHKQRFPIAPQWIPPARTACLTPTECLEASDSAENAPAMLHSRNVVLLPSIRWVRWGGRGDELRLRGVAPGSPGTDQTLATVGGRPTSVNRHRSRVVGHSAHEGHLFSAFPAPADSRTQEVHPP